jgi:hypothetical protein
MAAHHDSGSVQGAKRTLALLSEDVKAMKKATVWLMAGIGLLCLSAGAQADALRCGNRLIGEGDHFSRLLRYCGEPEFVETRSAQRAFTNLLGQVVFHGYAEEIRIEDWTYNFGPHKLMRIVRIENGQVAEIRQLGRGFPP